MQFSKFGEKFSSETGIFRLMQDLDEALNQRSDLLFLGGGNPAVIEPVSEAFRLEADKLVNDRKRWQKVTGSYDSSQGDTDFINELCSFFNRNHHFNITNRNIAITNGSQNSFFLIFNLLAGDFKNGQRKKIALPLLPEYIGYADASIAEDTFQGFSGRIEKTGAHRFKYFLNPGSLSTEHNYGLFCVSRPTNPSGNVIKDEEIEELASIADSSGAFLMIDNAYGLPFPRVIFRDASLVFKKNMILSFSLSKLGLPGLRTGIIVGPEEIIEAISKINAIINLAQGSMGPALLTQLLKNDRIISLCKNEIKPFYENKSDNAVKYLTGRLKKSGVRDFYIHQNEGAFFIWLWLPGLNDCQKLYDALKRKNVLVVPGHHYFIGMKEASQHSRECIRISIAQPENIIHKGLDIIADEATRFL